MLASKELQRFAIGFIQGSSAGQSNLQAWIDAALAHLDAKEKHALKTFIDDVLAKDVDDATLQRIWDDTPADYYVTADGGVRGFFKLVSERIGTPLRQ